MGMGICVFSGFSFMQCCALQVLHTAHTMLLAGGHFTLMQCTKQHA